MASCTEAAQWRLPSLWASFMKDSKKEQEEPPSAFKASAREVHWLIKNRGGVTPWGGLTMAPSLPINSHEILLWETKEGSIDRFQVSVGENTLHGAIYYPPKWDQKDKSCCMLYHNPNGITVPEYFGGGSFSWTPAKFTELTKCPIVLYDYQGTGLSQEHSCKSSLESVVTDGEAALRYALEKFDSVKVIGSGLGGAVATVSLDRHLQKNEKDTSRVSLINHDSFSTSTRIVPPDWWTTAISWITWSRIAVLDAEASLKNLIKRKIRIIVLYHINDPVTPKEARMGDSMLAKFFPEMSIIRSLKEGHANLSPEMMKALRKCDVHLFP